MWYWHKHRHVDQWKIEDPSLNSYSRSYLILEKEAKTIKQPQKQENSLKQNKNNIQNNNNKNTLKKR